MSITYASYVSQLANIMVVSSADANFATFLPGAIDYAEGRVYRDLNLVAQYVTDAWHLLVGHAHARTVDGLRHLSGGRAGEHPDISGRAVLGGDAQPALRGLARLHQRHLSVGGVVQHRAAGVLGAAQRHHDHVRPGARPA